MNAFSLIPKDKNLNELGKTPNSSIKRKLLKKKLAKESKFVRNESIAILHEFERY